jgi:hypothetical protein
MNNLSCAGRLSEVATVVAPLLFLQLRTQASSMLNSKAALSQRVTSRFRLHAAQLDVTARDQFAVIESSACIEAPDGTLYVVPVSRRRPKKSWW